MKQLKKLAALCLAITCAFGVTITATACNFGGENSASGSTTNSSSAESSTASSSTVDSSTADSSTADSSTEDSSTADPTDAYVFYVKNADGTPATNIFLQLCVGGLNGKCFAIGNLDENGRIASSQSKAPLEAGVYDIHLFRDGVELAFDGPATTSANFEIITLTLKD